MIKYTFSSTLHFRFFHARSFTFRATWQFVFTTTDVMYVWCCSVATSLDKRQNPKTLYKPRHIELEGAERECVVWWLRWCSTVVVFPFFRQFSICTYENKTCYDERDMTSLCCQRKDFYFRGRVQYGLETAVCRCKAIFNDGCSMAACIGRSTLVRRNCGCSAQWGCRRSW